MNVLRLANTQPKTTLVRFFAHPGALGNALQIAAIVALGLPILLMREGWINGDAFYYLGTARYYYQTGNLIVPDSHYVALIAGMRSPLFPLLLSVMFHLVGPTVTAATILTKAAAFVSLCTVFLIGKALWGWRAGLLSAALASTAVYLADFATHLMLDQVQACFMLLSLYAFVLAWNKENVLLSLSGGLALGLGFLTKESAVLLVVMPLLALLLVRSGNDRLRVGLLFAFWIGFGIAVGVWWIYYFANTGQIFLLDTFYFRSVISRIRDFNTAYLLMGLATGILLASWIASSLYRLTQNPTWAERVKKTLKSLGFLVGWSLCLALLSTITLTISKLGTWFYSLAEVFPRLAGFYELWYHIRVVPEQPLMFYAPFALLPIAISAIWRREKSDVLLLTAIVVYLPLFLAMGFKGRNYWQGRYLMTIFWIGYLVLGRAVILLGELAARGMALARRGQGKRAWLLNVLSIGIVCVCLPQVVAVATDHDPMHASNPNEVWNNEGVQAASAWLQTLPSGTRIASNLHYLPAMDFYTGGRFDWVPLYDYARSPESANPIDYETSLYRLDGGVHLARRGGSLISSTPLYVRLRYYHDFVQAVSDPEEFVPRAMYMALDQNRLLQSLQENEIDYIVLAVGTQHPQMFDTVPQFFVDAFDTVFLTKWQQAPDYTYEIHVFQVAPDEIQAGDYPVAIFSGSNGFQDLLNLASSEEGAEPAVQTLLHALSWRPVLITPSTPDNLNNYVLLAEGFEMAGQIDRAAVQYHIALADAPEEAEQILTAAQRLAALCGGCAGPRMLKGDVYRAREQFQLAYHAYTAALSGDTTDDLVKAIAHRGLGATLISLGNLKRAVGELEQSIELSPFGNKQSHHLLMIARAGLYESRFEFDQAVAMYSEVIADSTFRDSLPSPVTERTAFDLIQRFGQASAECTRDGCEIEEMIHPALFVVANQYRFVLYSHPPGQVSYTLQVPSAGRLRFAPLLAPEVWQLGKGDGVQFDIYLDDGQSVQSIYSRYVDPKNIPAQRAWLLEEVDLSRWSGQTVKLVLSTEPGPNANNLFDWAGWGEPRVVQPVAYDFAAHLPDAEQRPANANSALATTEFVARRPRAALVQRPHSRIVYALTLPSASSLYFDLGIDPGRASLNEMGDLEYTIYVRDLGKPATLHQVFQRHVDPARVAGDRTWVSEQVDLAQFGGKQVEIVFQVLAGANNEGAGNWGVWVTPLLVDETVADTVSSTPPDGVKDKP